MAKHHPRFFTKIRLVMGAATGLALMVSTPASAETIDLICRYADDTGDLHVSIDLDRQSVVNTRDSTRSGPYAASISDTLIRWTTAGGERQYTIDRVAGTMNEIIRLQYINRRAQCRRATQKF